MSRKVKYSMPRGDSRSLPLAISALVYSTGASVFFTIKSTPDNDLTDSTAVVKKTLTDSNISSNNGTTVEYLLSLAPSDTNSITPAVYRAEFQFVSADGLTVETFPDPATEVMEWEITADLTRRTSA